MKMNTYVDGEGMILLC